jgi:hypothetical protein
LLRGLFLVHRQRRGKHGCMFGAIGLVLALGRDDLRVVR